MARCCKILYSDRVDALIALLSTQRARGSKREECRVYACPKCCGWHLTSLRAWRIATR